MMRNNGQLTLCPLQWHAAFNPGVEYRIPGIVQVQTHEKAALTFASALRSILRQDPGVVLIGEIRDRETPAIAIQASLTGHLVFAALHTNDACSSIVRLTHLGVDPVKLAEALKGGCWRNG
jgi:type II secretory ATPase GspE/PulE/Tfp pilus assembly ATPase PilB-like protein